MSWDESSPKTNFSSLAALFFSSKRAMISFTAQLFSISALVPRIVVSSANKEKVRVVLLVSELNFPNWLLLGIVPSGRHLNSIPTAFQVVSPSSLRRRSVTSITI